MSRAYPDTLLRKIGELAARYPKKEAALIPVLRLVQDEAGCISPDEEEFVARTLGLKKMRVREVVTFYTMLTRRPLGKYHIQVCTNLSCSLLGSATLLDYLQKKLGIGVGETSPDRKFTLTTVECLGACDQAPCMMVNTDYHGNLDPAAIDRILNGLD
jgi:NADH-quinone oxidoreductase E subunit